MICRFTSLLTSFAAVGLFIGCTKSGNNPPPASVSKNLPAATGAVKVMGIGQVYDQPNAAVWIASDGTEMYSNVTGCGDSGSPGQAVTRPLAGGKATVIPLNVCVDANSAKWLNIN